MEDETKSIITKWEYCGTASQLNISSYKIKGVYIWIYKGTVPRVIYVGTSFGKVGIWGRNIDNHIKNSFTGNNTLFSPDADEDVYSIMSKSDKNYTKDELDKYHSDLIEAKKLWIAGTHTPTDKYPLLHRTEEYFMSNWLNSGRVEKFLNNCEIWACKIENNDKFNKEVAEILETQLHIAFGNYSQYKLIYYTSNEKQNWLGRQLSNKAKIKSIKFEFTNYPDIDDNEKKVLDNLYEYIDSVQWFDHKQ